MILEYYNFTGNDISEYRPFIAQSVIFYDEHYRMRNKKRTGQELDENGKLGIYPSNALERHTDCTNPTSVIAGLTAILNRLLTLPDTMQGKEKKERWKKMLSILPEYPKGLKNGLEYLKPAVDYEHSHAHSPEMYPLYPYQLFGLGLDNIELVKNTFLHANITEKERMNADNPWYQGVIHFAHLGMVKEAQTTIPYKLGDGPCRFPAFFLGGDYSPDHNRGGSGMIGLQEMLMQTIGDKILLFPAWPKDWDVEFKLHAPKNTTVEAVLKNGILEQLKIIPELRSNDVQIMMKN
jgi:hypothetical protein